VKSLGWRHAAAPDRPNFHPAFGHLIAISASISVLTTASVRVCGIASDLPHLGIAPDIFSVEIDTEAFFVIDEERESCFYL
jgi:hypothetical protein